MCGQLYLDTMHVDRANLIMRYLSIQRSNLEIKHTVAIVRISRSFLWYAMKELMHVMQRQIDACNAKTNWCMQCKNQLMHVMQSWFLGYMDGHSSHSPWLNHGYKIECLQNVNVKQRHWFNWSWIFNDYLALEPKTLEHRSNALSFEDRKSVV